MLDNNPDHLTPVPDHWHIRSSKRARSLCSRMAPVLAISMKPAMPHISANIHPRKPRSELLLPAFFLSIVKELQTASRMAALQRASLPDKDIRDRYKHEQLIKQARMTDVS